ncbi:MAG: hypothetical protein IJS50_06040, partial [Desulfovibrio sp.]|nr:hypothetical protein [Desulfovibrio sp.]
MENAYVSKASSPKGCLNKWGFHRTAMDGLKDEKGKFFSSLSITRIRGENFSFVNASEAFFRLR